jgi:regulator of protease activity HflC (stomatin/prohibitin superfamily)
LQAEGDKRARIERSEGEQQEKINQALGDKEAFIARAEGQAKSIEAVAEAQAKAITAVRASFGDPGVAANYLVAMEYLKRFGEFGMKASDKVFIPYEATASMGSLGGIRELFNTATGKVTTPPKA